MLKKYLDKLKKFYKDHKKPILIGGGVVLALLLGLLVYNFVKSDTVDRTDPNSTSEVSEPEIVLVASPLTGIEVTPDLAERPTVAAVVENSPEARPQSGLVEAGAIYEFLVEAGITRFVAVHQEQMAEKVGPIRSLRTQFIDVILGYDAGIAHDGGDPKALTDFAQLAGRDLAGGGIYWRSTDRWAPHNEYTSGEGAFNLMYERGYNSSEYDPWQRKDDAPLEVPTASSITIEPSSYLYHIDYKYDPTSNTYARSMADQLHKDKETGAVISPNVVIAMKAPHRIVDSAGHQGIDLVGTGDAWVFQDGGVVKGKWKKSSRSTNFSFVDSEGKAIKLNTGQAWVTVIPTDRTVDYTP
jgi:hypothetical protein